MNKVILAITPPALVLSTFGTVTLSPDSIQSITLLILSITGMVTAISAGVISLLKMWKELHAINKVITSVNEEVAKVHVVVNSQREAMVEEIRALKEHIRQGDGVPPDEPK